jgi:hypothetical protein
MMTRRINALLWIGIIGTLVIGTNFITDVYRAFRGDHGIWWTPQAMRLPIEETKDNFELYIGGEPLRNYLSNGTLFSVDKNGTQYPVVSKDITVRLNNWDKVRASVLTHSTMSGFAFGVAVTLFVIGLIQVFQHRKKPR